MTSKPKRIFVSNRLPFHVDARSGNLNRGSGGLVSALLGVSLEDPFSWMGFETDPATAEILRTRGSEIKNNLQCHPVLLNKELYDTYYDGVANDLIWPLFHYETSIAEFSRPKWEKYEYVNQLMAEEILRVAQDHDTVWVHDFHFLLLPRLIKKINPKIKVGFFLHIPFPNIEIFRHLPVAEQILKSLSQADLLGFHEHSYLSHFNECIKTLLGVESTLYKARFDSHTLHLGAYPISIDTAAFKTRSSSEVVHSLTNTYRNSKEIFQILGIDRLDYTKGLELKLRGFQRALRKYPELRGKISLLQVAVPSRQKVPYYIKIKEEIDRLIGNICGEFATTDYTPLQYVFNSVHEETLMALYKRADAALVTSKRDGMNLVAMEYIMAQDVQTAGVLVLSEFTGVASMLADAVTINPWDVDCIADAIYTAYKMPLTERKARMANMQESLSKYSATQWAEKFLDDLEKNKTSKNLNSCCQLLSPSSDQWPRHLLYHLQLSGGRLIVDLDGMLNELQKRPDVSMILEQMRNALDNLHEDLEIYILSGRSKEYLETHFGDSHFILAAEHGAFYKKPGHAWKNRVSSNLSLWYEEICAAMKAYTARVPFSSVEVKEASLLWHFDQSPKAFAETQARRLNQELKAAFANEPVTIHRNGTSIEAKAMECNKANFARWLMQNDASEIFTICIGDERSDEELFVSLTGKSLSIKVGTEATSAQYRLQNQKQTLRFFEELQNFFEELHYQKRDIHA